MVTRLKDYGQKILLCALLLSGTAHAQRYPWFGPANGILVGSTTTYETTAAAWSNIQALLTGTCNSSTVVNGAGACVTPATGTITGITWVVPSGFSISGSPCTNGSCSFTLSTSLSGVLKGTGSGFTVAGVSDILGLFSGTCNSSALLNGAGACENPIPNITVSGLAQSDSIVTGKNLLPDSAFTADSSGNAIYWLAWYPDSPPYTGSGVCTATSCYGIHPGTNGSWNAGSNTMFYIGTGSAAPSSLIAESQVFALPNSASTYSLTIQLTANLTNASGGTPQVVLWSTTGQLQSVLASYCIEPLVSGTSSTYTWTCSGIPGNVGLVALAIYLNGVTVTSGLHVTFSNPQVEIGTSATAYEQTVGFNSLLSQAGIGPSYWPQLLQMLPERRAGTLATSQTAVTLTTSAQEILTSVSSAPTLNFGCSANGCEQYPGGMRSQTMWESRGIAQVQCVAVTTAGTLTVNIATKSVSSNETWSSFAGSDGATSATQNVPVNAGTSYFYIPLMGEVEGSIPNVDYGEYDIQAQVSAALAPSGACKVVAASLEFDVIPNDSTVAGAMNPLSYGDRSHLVH